MVSVSSFNQPGPVAKRALTVTVGLALLLAGSACAATPNPREQQRAAMEPTGAPSPPASPISDPRGSREVTGEGFRLSVDSSFQRMDLKSRSGEPMLVVRRASREPTLPIQVAVLREPDPAQDVVEQSYALEVSKRVLATATDISRSEVVWPKTERAVLVQWTQNVATSDDAVVSTRYWQLNAQVSRKLILVVVGFAPAAEFDESKVGDVVRTFRITT